MSVIRMQPDGEAAIRLTTAYYYTPKGRLIHNKGIEPHLVEAYTPREWRRVQIRRAHLETPELYSDEEKAEFADVVDRQLQRAVDMLEAHRVFEGK